MNVVLFEREMERKVKNLFKADKYHFEHVEIIVPEKLEHNDRFELANDSFYYLANNKFDIPISVALYLGSENNFLATSKSDWEFDNDDGLKLETFRNYLHVRTENSTLPFEFKLKFIKVTPYRL